MEQKTEMREEGLAGIGKERLTPIVREVLGDPAAEVGEWEYRRLQWVVDPSGKSEAERVEVEGDVKEAVAVLLQASAESARSGGPMRGVYRYEGTAKSNGGEAAWSVILKIQDDQRQRERLAYQSGVLGELPEDFGMPVCYRVDQQENGEYWLWVEDVKDEVGEVWPIVRFGMAARHLAHFNGAYLTGRALPDEPWLTRKPSKRWELIGQFMEQLESVRAHPLVAMAWTVENADGVRRMWKEKERFAEVLSGLPDTLCHQDAQRSNLVARQSGGRERTVAIDWGSVGIGTLGMEIAQLSTNFRSVASVEIGQLQELSDVVFEGYLEGLRDVGWEGERELLRLGYTASAALQNGLSDIGSLRGAVNPDGYDRMRLMWGDRSVAANMERRGELLRFILGLGDEARLLMGER